MELLEFVIDRLLVTPISFERFLNFRDIELQRHFENARSDIIQLQRHGEIIFLDRSRAFAKSERAAHHFIRCQKGMKIVTDLRRRKPEMPLSPFEIGILEPNDRNLLLKTILLSQLREKLITEGLNPEDLIYVTERFYPASRSIGNPHVLPYSGKLSVYSEIVKEHMDAIRNGSGLDAILAKVKDWDYLRDIVGAALAYTIIETQEKYFGAVIGTEDEDAPFNATLLRPYNFSYNQEGSRTAVFVYDKTEFKSLASKYTKSDLMHLCAIPTMTVPESTFVHNDPVDIDRSLVAIAYLDDPGTKIVLGQTKPQTEEVVEGIVPLERKPDYSYL